MQQTTLDLNDAHDTPPVLNITAEREQRLLAPDGRSHRCGVAKQAGE